MKCPKCNEEMTVLCRRGASGFLDEFYEKCFFCGYEPTLHGQASFRVESRRGFQPGLGKLKRHGIVNTLMVASLCVVLVFAILQMPVPQTVFAFEAELGPIGEVLKCFNLVNFTISNFSFNYSDGSINLNVLADYMNLESTSVSENVTLYSFTLRKVIIRYADAARKMDMGMSSLTLNVRVNYVELLARIEGIADLPLWTTIANGIFK